MDFATLIGLVLGIGLVMWSCLSAGSLETFIDVPSIAIVVGGTIATALISFPLRNVLAVSRVIKNAFLTRPVSPESLIKELVRYAEMARRDGILSLEHVTRDNKNVFLVSGIQMAVDGTDPEMIEQIMTSELETLAERHAMGKALMDNMGKYAPAFGMIGTLVGLVLMLKNMDDPSAIGPGMAVALLTTLYGSLMANIVFLPFSDKLSLRSQEELLLKSIVIRGVMSIQSGDNPRIVEQRLKIFLPPSVRTGRKEGE